MTYYIDYNNLRYFHVISNNGSGLNYCEEYGINDEGRLELVDDDVRLTDNDLSRLRRENI